MVNKEKIYIAYGSNLNLPQMAQRCPAAKVLGKSELKDYELLFRGSKTGSYLYHERYHHSLRHPFGFHLGLHTNEVHVQPLGVSSFDCQSALRCISGTH